jgi:PAS domain S-box-containing protein
MFDRSNAHLIFVGASVLSALVLLAAVGLVLFLPPPALVPAWAPALLLGLLGAAILAIGWVAFGMLQRREAEKSLRDSEARQRSLALLLERQNEASPDGIVVVSPERRWLWFNRRFVELWGFPEEVVDARSTERALEWALPQLADPETFAASLIRLYASREEKVHDEVALKDGRTFERYSAPLWTGTGEYCGRVWHYRDVTARKQAERVMHHNNQAERKRAADALAHQERQYRQLVELAQEGIWALDHEGRTTFVNPRLVEMLGQSAADLLGQPLATFVSVEWQEAARLHLERARSGSRVEFELVFRRRDGQALNVLLAATALKNGADAPPGILAVVSDLTERRHLEEQFRQAQKMEAIGRLAGGVAHDFNNLLMIITGFTHLLQEQVGGEEPFRTFLQEIHTAAFRAADLTRQLLAFGRKVLVHPRVLDCSILVGSLEAAVRQAVGSQIQVTVRLSAGLPSVKVDPNQVEQALRNLAVNARETMPQGGELTIETSPLEVGPSDRRLPALPPGRYVLLTVRDTGPGLGSAALASIFEPFVTNKELGKGSGLGLAAVHSIVQQANGHIEVASEPGRGTTFRIYLPAHVEEHRPPPDSSRGTVLLVEDDLSSRAMTQLLLQQAGWTVLEAGSGTDALALASRHPGPIDVLVTNLVLPQMNGRELAEALLVARPGLKILYVAGYMGEPLPANTGGAPWVRRPIGAEELTGKLNGLLTSA